MIVFFLNAKFGIPETFTHFYLLSALFRSPIFSMQKETDALETRYKI